MNNNYVQEMQLGRTYRCQIHFMSGVLGTLAEKMFPSLLVAPGSMYIELRLASANNACVSYVTQKNTIVAGVYVGCSYPSTENNYYTGQSNFASGEMIVPYAAGYNVPDNLDNYNADKIPRVRKVPTGFVVPNTLQLNIENVQLVCRQLVLTDTAASAIIARAAGTDISLHTNSFRCFNTEATGCIQDATGNGVSMQLLIPAKIASANSLFVIFRDRRQSNDTTKENFKRQAIGLEHDGTGCSYQLRLGNELIPQTPINTPNEALMQLLRALHDYPNTNHVSVLGQCKQTGWGSGAVQTDFSHSLIQYPCSGWLTLQREGRPIWRDPVGGGETGYENVGNYDNIGIAQPSGNLGTARKWNSNHGHNFAQLWGPTSEPFWYSTFAMGFDLDNFQNNHDTMRSGKYLGNNTVQLILNKAKVSPVDMLTNDATSALINYIVGHDVRLSFQAGGVVQSFY